jgi:RNA polymerase sigma factor (sigma-70 family)
VQPMDDAQLVEAARSGDDTAWAAIYDRYADKLHDHCHRILRDRDEAADALHDAYLAASRNLHQLRDPSRLRPWLYSICRHTSLRRLKARDRVELTDAPDDISAPDADLDRGVRSAELTELVWAAAAGLNGRDQALLDLHLRQGLDGQDLADAMGTSLSNSYVMLSRMRDQVERSLGALLIARLGREECEELDQLLQGWDGRFSPLLRKRVARHVDGCETCSEKRKAVASPLALLAAAPLVPAPALLKARVISSIRNPDGAPAPHVPFTKEGFASLGRADANRRRIAGWVAAAAAVLLLVVGGGVLLAAGDSDDTVETAAMESADGSEDGSSTSLGLGTSTSVDGAAAPITDGGGSDLGDIADGGTNGNGAPGGSTGGLGGPDGAGSATGGTTGGDGGTAGGSGATGGTGGASSTSTTVQDGFGPTISNLRISLGECGRTRSLTLSVTATDPAGVTSASLTPASNGISPTGKTAMTRGSGSTWTKALTVPSTGGTFTVVIEAVDGNGIDTDDPFQFTVPTCSTTTTAGTGGPITGGQ